jgi:putative transcriptional regulator
MSKEAFEMIKAGLDDALAYMEGDTSRARVVNPIDVKAIRAVTGKSQADFAASYHIPVGTIRDWEQARRQPDAPARALLSIIKADPAGVERMLASATAA